MSYQVVVDSNIVSFVIVLYNMWIYIYIYMIIMTYIHVIIKILILLEMKSNSMPNIFFFWPYHLPLEFFINLPEARLFFLLVLRPQGPFLLSPGFPGSLADGHFVHQKMKQQTVRHWQHHLRDVYLLQKRKEVANEEWQCIWVFPKIVVPPNHPFK